MKTVLLVICLTQLYLPGLCSLPSPIDVTVHSLNFEHILSWKPGPDTPLDTMYNVCYWGYPSSAKTSHRKRWCLPYTSVTKVNMTDYLVNVYEEYNISVQAFHNGMLSPGKSVTFKPWTDTVLGPPELFVEGCRNCLKLNISFTSRKLNQTKNIYNALQFNIHLKKSGQEEEAEVRMSQGNYTFNDLLSGVEYCVRVSPLPNQKKMLPSNWACAFTSSDAQNTVSAVLLLFALVLFLGAVILYLFCTCNFYNLKMHHPQVLTTPAKAYFIEDSAVCDPVPDPVKLERRCRTENTAEELRPFKGSFNEKREQRNCYEKTTMELSDSSGSNTMPHNSVCEASTSTIATENSGNSSTSALEKQDILLVSVLPLEGELICENGGWREALPTRMLLSSERPEDDVDEKGEEGCVDVNIFSLKLGALEEDEDVTDCECTDSILGENHVVITPDNHQAFVSIRLTENSLEQRAKELQTNAVLTQGNSGHIHTDCLLMPFAKGYIRCTQEDEEDEGLTEEEDRKCSDYVQR